jgi:hypothetical protein
MISRKTLCISSQAPGFTLHHGDDTFNDSVAKHYSAAENNAAEKLITLKKTVASLSNDEFWKTLLEGISDIFGAEHTFVSKRIVPEDPTSVVEMPAIGEPGSCFNAVALYINDGKTKEYYSDYEYFAYGGACAHMRHDKVFVAPSTLADFIPTRVPEFKFRPESYIGIPLFSEGKCFAHFGCIWSLSSSFVSSGLTWGFVEMSFHALEDLVTAKLLERQSLKSSSTNPKPPAVIPQAAVLATQSLKPYARSLSHELRTPMQSIFGMLDLMHASIEEALGRTLDKETAKFFLSMKDDIELIQGNFKSLARYANANAN